ncbi:hypothetical protein ACKWTF_013382 [Chironomus riparius]
MHKKSIWTDKFENKFTELSKDKNRPPLHAVIMPHSHNDPGWLKTFEGYFQSHTHNILDNVVKKLPGLEGMTFIWTEICFLQLWWDNSTEEQHKILKQLVDEGRVEIMSGGWVMTDEAVAHIYAMVDQLVEGHQWLKTHLNVTPSNSWSIDPFGHGSTMPYLYGSADFDGAIIQRIHYGWKEWLASRQYGDFIWRPSWNTKQSDQRSVLTHNMPFDMYFVDSSCGPHVDKCKPYDFRWFGRINDKELQSKADQLVAEYSRSASLYPHNTFLAIVGGDFRYEVDYEFDAQYNYKKIIDYVNANPSRYNNAKLQFGTPKDYFKIIKERHQRFPTMVGDLFPYGDVFTNGNAAYWTGYYTTRPFLKIISRDLEHNLRSAEILFTLAWNKANQMKNEKFTLSFEQIYPKLVLARRNLGLFQHHDAITGTSKAIVMTNYLERLFSSLKYTIEIQNLAVELFMQTKNYNQNFLSSSLVRENANEVPKNLVLDVTSNIEIVLYNSLTTERIDVVTVNVKSSNIEVLDSNDNPVPSQVNSIFRRKKNSSDIEEIKDEFELIFLVKLPPLSLSKYRIKSGFANLLANSVFFSGNNDDDIEIENSKIQLSFNKTSGFLKSVSSFSSFDDEKMQIDFGAYNTAKGKSGAYLFKPDEKNPEIADIFAHDKLSKIIVTDGELATYVKLFYGKLLTHTVRILKTDTHLDEAIYIENNVNMNGDHNGYEIFMRMKTSIENEKETEFFTDLNGFQWQRRKKVSKIGVDGNYYPITIGAFIQDKRMRMTFLTSHAQGATSPNEGELEVMVDRRTPIDDDRGMQEGVTDNLETIQKHWITFEFIANNYKNYKKYQVPTVHASTLSNILKYPVNIFVNSANNHELTSKVEFLKNSFPCDMHLFNLRTLTSSSDEKLPTRSSLLIVNRMSYDCKYSTSSGDFYNESCDQSLENFDNVDIFNDVNVNFVQSTSLTGLKNNGYITSFNHNPIEPMEIRTFNMTFH